MAKKVTKILMMTVKRMTLKKIHEDLEAPKVVDLQDALDDPKAEFEAMMGDKGEDDGEFDESRWILTLKRQLKNCY